MQKPTVLITGGTSGIGLATARLFAQNGHPVVITARDAAKAERIVAAIQAQTGNRQVRWLWGDLSTIAGCQALVATVQREVPDLQVLLNNAGVFMTEKVLNPDGFETNFMVNCLAPFILATGLADVLARNHPARILNVSTGLHLHGHFDLAQTPYGHDFGSRASYRNAKLASALHTVELAQRLHGRGITVNAFSPGLFNTGVMKGQGLAPLFFKYAGMVYALFRPLAGSALAPYYLATAPELAGATGRFFYQQKPAAFAPQVANAALRQQLWQQTLAWLAAAGAGPGRPGQALPLAR